MSSVAVCARVVVSLGARAIPPFCAMPRTMPEPQAHCMAGMAYSLTAKASLKLRIFVSFPALTS